jgi:tetratricopeptide (TPR) repeat protein
VLIREQQPTTSLLQKPTVQLLLIAGGLTLAVVVGYVFFFSPLRRLVRAAEAGNLVTPPGENAYEIYLELKHGGLSATDLAEIRTEVAPLLRAQGDAAFQSWHDQSNLSSEDWQNIEKLYTWLAELEPADTEAQARLHYARGQLAFNREDYVNSASEYREAMLLSPQWAMPANALGRVAVRQREFDAAEAYYKRAVELEPNWVYPNLNLAGVYMRRERFDLALTYYEKSVQLAPEKPSTHFRLGQTYDELRRYEEARHHYTVALELAQKTPEADLDPAAIQKRIASIERKLQKK